MIFGCGGNTTANTKTHNAAMHNVGATALGRPPTPDTTTTQNISDTVSPAVGADSISALSNDTPDTHGAFTNPRDGKTYRTVY